MYALVSNKYGKHYVLLYCFTATRLDRDQNFVGAIRPRRSYDRISRPAIYIYYARLVNLFLIDSTRVLADNDHKRESSQ